jgi:hypothetical protein
MAPSDRPCEGLGESVGVQTALLRRVTSRADYITAPCFRKYFRDFRHVHEARATLGAWPMARRSGRLVSAPRDALREPRSESRTAKTSPESHSVPPRSAIAAIAGPFTQRGSWNCLA